jgi:hypothetical protein
VFAARDSIFRPGDFQDFLVNVRRQHRPCGFSENFSPITSAARNLQNIPITEVFPDQFF